MGVGGWGAIVESTISLGYFSLFNVDKLKAIPSLFCGRTAEVRFPYNQNILYGSFFGSRYLRENKLMAGSWVSTQKLVVMAVNSPLN